VPHVPRFNAVNWLGVGFVSFSLKYASGLKDKMVDLKVLLFGGGAPAQELVRPIVAPRRSSRTQLRMESTRLDCEILAEVGPEDLLIVVVITVVVPGCGPGARFFAIRVCPGGDCWPRTHGFSLPISPNPVRAAFARAKDVFTFYTSTNRVNYYREIAEKNSGDRI